MPVVSALYYLLGRSSLHNFRDGIQMFVAGTSTRHPWEKWPKRCWESLEAASTISRLNQTLTQQFETWRQRPLQEHWRILYAGRWCILAFVMERRPIPRSS